MSDQFIICDGMAPHGNGTVSFYARAELFDLDFGYVPGVWVQLSRSIQQCLKKPTSVFAGLKRANYEQGLCYCNASRKMGFALFVFVAVDGGRYVLLDFEERRGRFTDDGCPEDWADDFGEKLWPKP